MRPKHLKVIFILLALILPASPAHAGGVVTICDEAHLLAALAGGGTVTFACSGTITLSAEIVTSADTTIDGSGQDVTFSGSHTVRVLTVRPGVTLELNHLTVAYGSVSDYDSGGGISNHGVLTIRNSNVFQNSGGGGGGIDNNGVLIVTSSSFSSNGSVLGGGIANNDGGVLEVYDSNFSGNNASWGGGIASGREAVLIVSNSTFSNNTATQQGGAIFSEGVYFSSGSVVVSRTSFIGNSATHGGAIASDGALSVNDSTFSRNVAWSGGGIEHGGPYHALNVSRSTFRGNHSTGPGGGIGNLGSVANITNSTFYGNDAGQEGGGAYNDLSTMTVTNSTFSGNSASAGGSIFNFFGEVTLKNTIVGDSPTDNNCGGAIADGGGNLSYPEATCPGINANPMLGPLQDNGGPTETMALRPGSAAIDAGIDEICAASPVNNLDQRGVTRPQGLHCDSGAVEQIQDPSAVSLGTLNAQGTPGAFPPTLVFGLLLVALMSIGAFRRVRPMRRVVVAPTGTKGDRPCKPNTS